jgi:hypothetical protein
MMPWAGRLALIRVVLAEIPLNQVMVLSLNKKTLKHVNKILRGFLWPAGQRPTAVIVMSTGPGCAGR